MRSAPTPPADAELRCGDLEFTGRRVDVVNRLHFVVERIGSDADRNWTVDVASFQLDVRNPWVTMRMIEPAPRSLAWRMLRDVFSRRMANELSDAFEADVVAAFGHRSFRIDAAEIAEWHYDRILRSAQAISSACSGCEEAYTLG